MEFFQFFSIVFSSEIKTGKADPFLLLPFQLWPASIPSQAHVGDQTADVGWR